MFFFFWSFRHIFIPLVQTETIQENYRLVKDSYKSELSVELTFTSILGVGDAETAKQKRFREDFGLVNF